MRTPLSPYGSLLKVLRNEKRKNPERRTGDGRNTRIHPRYPVPAVRLQGAPSRKVPVVIQVNPLGKNPSGTGKVRNFGRSR